MEGRSKGVWGDGGRECGGDAAWAKGDLAAAPFAAVPRWTEVAWRGRESPEWERHGGGGKAGGFGRWMKVKKVEAALGGGGGGGGPFAAVPRGRVYPK